MEDFIYEKPNALNRKECADVIEYFETMRKQGLVINNYLSVKCDKSHPVKHQLFGP